MDRGSIPRSSTNMIKIKIPGEIIIECDSVHEAHEVISKLGKRKCDKCYDGNSGTSDAGGDCRHCNGTGWTSR